MSEELKKVREALVFYSDESVRQADRFDSDGNPICSPISRDAGSRAEEALAIIDTLIANGGWHDISTAPRGVEVMVYYTNCSGRHRIVKAEYVQKHTQEADMYSDNYEYNEESDNYYTPEGWCELIDNWAGLIEGTPTHWHPLPPPPAQEAENG